METPETIAEAVERTTAASGVSTRVSDKASLEAVALMMAGGVRNEGKEEPPNAGKRGAA